MKAKLFAGLTALTLMACSHSNNDNNGAGPSTPSRVAEHKPNECPQGMVGSYFRKDDASVTLTIRTDGTNLILAAPKSGEIKVNGLPTKDQANGSSNTAICTQNTIEWRTTNTDGTQNSFTITKTAFGFNTKSVNKNGRGNFEFIRLDIGPNNSPDDGPNKTDGQPSGDAMDPMPDMPDMPTMPPPAPNNCNTGTEKTYSIIVNGCETGKHTFCSQGEYCAGLMDEALNHKCASKERVEKFNASCK